MHLVDAFQWADHTALAAAIRDSTWLFALIEVFHLFGITLLLGTLVAVNLRLFGLGLRELGVAELASDALPWTMGALLLTALSGTVLFVSEAMKCYESPPFMLKMILFGLALIFTFTFHRRLARKAPSPWLGRMGGFLSLALWFGVGFAGRAIAFY